jgi:cyclase
MLKRRLIPKLQLKRRMMRGGERMVLVTTVRFDHVTEIGDPVSQARIYQAQAVDELIFLDLDASHDRGALLDVVRSAAQEVFMPFTVGGGVRTVEDFRLLLRNGADKVSVNSAAIEDPILLSRAAEAYGAQCVVLSIDVRRKNGVPEVWTFGGTRPTGRHPAEWAGTGEALGAGEILITSIDHDGMRNGLDVSLIREVRGAVSVPVIASGGCGRASHFVDGFVEGNADAVASGTYFSFRDENPMQTRSQIRNHGIPIRFET